ncbi:transmembrane protein 225 isoform X1 [Oryctolagus cuniculus]|uniref:transmembrane protein 225 isoform X1 n=1 Tax=Oryctolagus cuniculus TaxID=9986 RepID=UPI003879B070
MTVSSLESRLVSLQCCRVEVIFSVPQDTSASAIANASAVTKTPDFALPPVTNQIREVYEITAQSQLEIPLTMVYISSRNMQAINMLSSSWATVLLTIGIIVDEWVELIPKRQTIKVNHSPWMTCCITTWPEGELERIRMMMVAVLGISFSLNLILGLEFTYVIPQNIYIHLLTATEGLLSGILLVCALLLYHQKLSQGESVYFTRYKISLATFIAYLNVFFFFVTGIISLIQCKQSINCSTWLHLTTPAKERENTQLPKTSVQVTSLPENTIMPRSIVRKHSSMSSKEDIPSKSQVQTRRVTWAL